MVVVVAVKQNHKPQDRREKEAYAITWIASLFVFDAMFLGIAGRRV